MCNLNVIVVLEFISRDIYLLFAICFSSKFQNSVFYQHMRLKSGLKFPRPLKKSMKERRNGLTLEQRNTNINLLSADMKNKKVN